MLFDANRAVLKLDEFRHFIVFVHNGLLNRLYSNSGPAWCSIEIDEIFSLYDGI